MFGFKKKNTLSFRKKIFKHTVKPIEYVHVDNPKTKQEYRQLHFNNWCKAKNVYSGSYLPVNHKDLLNKGWILTGKHFYNKYINKSKKLLHRPIYQYKRKSTNQEVEFHREYEECCVEHYHWKAGKDLFKDKYGVVGKKGEVEHHLVALDMDYTEDNEKVKKLKNFLWRLKYVKHRQ